ncbi:MAG TPA: hypothetical protein VMT18_10045 [Planctomycetota bacterium]|nr:hypothetical protein [Planctomycetota bacterium]
MSARATCADCGKTYAVPDPARTYKCKECGGRVSLPRESCGACGAPMEPGEAFCAACGDGQGAESERSPDVALEAEERRQAAYELQRGLTAVRSLRIVYALGALLFGVLTALMVVGLSALPERSASLVLMIAIGIALTCLHVVGFRQAPMQPFLWSVVIAATATASLALRLTEGVAPTLGLGLRAGFVVLLWSLVVPAVRVRRLIAEHPDLYTAHRLHGTEKRRHASRNAPERSREQFEQARARTARGSAAWAAGIALVLGGATAGGWVTHRGAALDARVEAFRSAWAQGDAAAVAGLAAASETEARRGLLASQVAAHGWGDAWPTLGEAQTQLGESQATVAWSLGDGLVHTTWSLGDDGWQLDKLRLPMPPLDGAVERLIAAWNARDVAGLAALYPPDMRESAATSIARVVERRAWGEAWPELLDANAVPCGETGANVTFRVAGDSLVTRWRFQEDPGWCLTSLNLPD